MCDVREVVCVRDERGGVCVEAKREKMEKKRGKKKEGKRSVRKEVSVIE